MTSPTQAQHSERSNPMGPDFNHANEFNSLDLTTRSLITVAMLTALGKQHELKGHVRGALNNGVTPEEISEVLLHASIYCGVPSAVEAYRSAAEVVDGPKKT